MKRTALIIVILAAGWVFGAGWINNASHEADFRIITVEAEYGQMVVEAQHFKPDGSHWFFEHYTFQGREAFQFTFGEGDVPGGIFLNRSDILTSIQATHEQRQGTGWAYGRQRLTTTPLDGSVRDYTGAPLLVATFGGMVGQSYQIQLAGPAAYFGDVPPVDMTVGLESGTVSIFYPQSDIETTSGDGEVWQNPDGKTFMVSKTEDDGYHQNSDNSFTNVSVTRCCRLSSDSAESWWRYNDVQIPNAATIDSAKFIFKESTVSQGSESILQGSDEDDTPIIADDTGWDNRVLTTASVQWDLASGCCSSNLTRLESPDVSPVVQEIVDRGGFVSGNDMAFFWNDDSDPAASLQTHLQSFDIVGGSGGGGTEAVMMQAEWTPSSPGTAWATIRDGSGNNFDDWAATATVQIAAATTTDKWQNVGRGIFTFDTSALPDADNVDSATLEFVAISKTDALTPVQSISLVTSAPASDLEIVPGDFDSLGTSLQATDLTIASLSADSSTFNTFTLTTAGEGTINRTGITKFGMRLTGDGTNTEPTWSSGNTASVVIATSEEGLSGDKRPKLTVTHDSRASGGTTPLSGTRVSPIIDLSGITALAYCAIGWSAVLPNGTSVAVETSVDGGSNYSAAANGDCPAGLTVGSSLASITDFRVRATLSTTDDTITPLITALGLIIEDETGQDLYYQLNTTPSAILTDRSGSGNTGTMSFPVAPSAVTATSDPLVSTRAELSFERAVTLPQVVSAVSGSATDENLFGRSDGGVDETGSAGMPGDSLISAIAGTDANSLPKRFVWFIFLGVAIIGAGAAVLLLTQSMLLAAIMMAAALGLAGTFGDGLIPLWILFTYVPMAAALVLIRPGKIAT